jgi:hypothetical protein
MSVAFSTGIGLTVLALLAAGCGGGKPASVASLTTAGTTSATSTSAAASAAGSRAALAECFTSHGFPASVGTGGGSGRTLDVFGVTMTGVDPASPQFKAALQACRKYLPGGGPPALSPAQQAVARRALSSFAACMRKHGLPGFPAPTAQGIFDPGALEGLDLTSPQAQAAAHTCQSLLPKVGPRLRLPGMS